MESLMAVLDKSGLNCTLEPNNVVKINHFPRENIYIEEHDGKYQIRNGVFRHILLALLLTFLFIFMQGNTFATGVIGLLALYSVVQGIRITIITSSLNIMLSTLITADPSKHSQA
ncbi:hypothetical protein [Thalassotalea litorea]|uniref:hypothetical protein n=1 Tax=Thalassotalea litorea TaxID=2020715 RepID=UPI003736100F